MYVFGSDQKIYLPEYNVYVYPDAVVICGTPIVSDNDSQAIINPSVIIEVLSPSTQDYDKIEKFNDYRTLPSFKEYVLISQDKSKVTTYFREENGTWSISDFKNIEDNVFLFPILLQNSILHFLPILANIRPSYNCLLAKYINHLSCNQNGVLS